MTDDTIKQRQFVEKVGLIFEQTGVPRMAGRILGWLLICDPPHQTAQQLAEALEASKGSISSMTRYLTKLGLIERVSLPGKRRDYFQMRPEAWRDMIKAKLSALSEFRLLAEAGLETLNPTDPTRRHRLEGMRDIYAFFEREFPALMAVWDAQVEENP